MSGVGIGELVWLVLAVLLGLSVVIAWMIKAESSRKFLKAEISRLKARLEASECEKAMITEEIIALGGNAGGSSGSQGSSGEAVDKKMIGKMTERMGELEKDNERLARELKEARSSLEEVYKALCSK